VTYLQLGNTAVTGAWGGPGVKNDVLSVSAEFRAEVEPLLQAAARGEQDKQRSQRGLRCGCGTVFAGGSLWGATLNGGAWC
jgi:hypothetical protein